MSVSLNQVWSVDQKELEKIVSSVGVLNIPDFKRLRVEVAQIYFKAGMLTPQEALYVSDPRFYHILCTDELVEGLETLYPPPQEDKSINEDLAKHFDKIASLYTENNDNHRARTFERGAKKIRNFPEKITYGKQLLGIKGLSHATYQEIDNFLSNPETPRLSELRKQVPSSNEIIELFESVHGIGRIKAEELYNKGYRTLESLTDLTHAQQLGIKYYLHFRERIPRREMIEYDLLLSSIFPKDLSWLIAGSYRRCKSSSGDIDLIIKNNDPNYLNMIVQLLIDRHIIVDTLALGPRKFMGVCILGENRIYRRIDIRIFTDIEWVYGVLYNTGSDELNKAMRTKALQMNLGLNEYSLTQLDYPYTSYFANSEREIFNYLQMEYLFPKNRN